MAIRKFNICVKKTYKKGEEDRAFWPQVGTLTYFPAYQDRKEGYKLEIPIFGDTTFYVFEQLEKGERQSSVKPPLSNEEVSQGGEINPEDIPY